MHRHAKEAEIGLSSLANVTSLNEVLLTSPGDVFLQVESEWLIEFVRFYY